MKTQQHDRPTPKHSDSEATSRKRRCIVSGESGPPHGLVRFVVDPAGLLTPDLAERLPGRGAWVSAQASALKEAVRRGLFSRALKRDAVLPEGQSVEAFVGSIERLLERRALSSLGLARKTGDVAAGFEKVAAALREGRVALLLCSADAAEDGAAKLRRQAGKTTAIARVFTADELSVAIGAGDVRHVAVRQGAAASRVLRDLERLAGFRPVFMETGLSVPIGAEHAP